MQKVQHLFSYRSICVINVGPTLEAAKKECQRLQRKLTNFSTSNTAACLVANTTKPSREKDQNMNVYLSLTATPANSMLTKFKETLLRS